MRCILLCMRIWYCRAESQKRPSKHDVTLVLAHVLVCVTTGTTGTTELIWIVNNHFPGGMIHLYLPISQAQTFHHEVWNHGNLDSRTSVQVRFATDFDSDRIKLDLQAGRNVEFSKKSRGHGTRVYTWIKSWSDTAQRRKISLSLSPPFEAPHATVL